VINLSRRASTLSLLATSAAVASALSPPTALVQAQMGAARGQPILPSPCCRRPNRFGRFTIKALADGFAERKGGAYRFVAA
jgi:hypothetical protein